MSKSEVRLVFYSICVVVSVFINGIRINFFLSPLRRSLRLKKVHFTRCFTQYWEEMESLKYEKSPRIVLEKSWNSVFPLTYESWPSIPLPVAAAAVHSKVVFLLLDHLLCSRWFWALDILLFDLPQLCFCLSSCCFVLSQIVLKIINIRSLMHITF